MPCAYWAISHDCVVAQVSWLRNHLHEEYKYTHREVRAMLKDQLLATLDTCEKGGVAPVGNVAKDNMVVVLAVFNTVLPLLHTPAAIAAVVEQRDGLWWAPTPLQFQLLRPTSSACLVGGLDLTLDPALARFGSTKRAVMDVSEAELVCATVAELGSSADFLADGERADGTNGAGSPEVTAVELRAARRRGDGFEKQLNEQVGERKRLQTELKQAGKDLEKEKKRYTKLAKTQPQPPPPETVDLKPAQLKAIQQSIRESMNEISSEPTRGKKRPLDLEVGQTTEETEGAGKGADKYKNAFDASEKFRAEQSRTHERHTEQLQDNYQLFVRNSSANSRGPTPLESGLEKMGLTSRRELWKFKTEALLQTQVDLFKGMNDDDLNRKEVLAIMLAYEDKPPVPSLTKDTEPA
jgi:hypothetical protein